MNEREYINSFGWKPEYLTEDELKQVREEIKEIESGKVILDGVLAFKLLAPQADNHRTLHQNNTQIVETIARNER